MCCSKMDEYDFEFAVDTFTILNLLSASKNCGQTNGWMYSPNRKWATEKNPKQTPMVNFWVRLQSEEQNYRSALA